MEIKETRHVDFDRTYMSQDKADLTMVKKNRIP
jgi:hypothetical protein